MNTVYLCLRCLQVSPLVRTCITSRSIRHNFSSFQSGNISNYLSKTQKVRVELLGQCFPINVISRTPRYQLLHTSSPKRALPLLQWLIVKPLMKISAGLLGRAARNTWKGLPENRRQIIWEDIKRYRWHIASILGLWFGGSYAYYYAHLHEAPYSGRKRFIVFNDYQMKKIIKEEYEQFLKQFDGKFLYESHPLHQVTVKIAKKIIQGNKDFPQIANRQWAVHVVNNDVTNAFVLPNGHIFVFTGLFKTCQNEEQLGIVLAHEMAHVVMNHSAELISFSEFLDFMLIVVLTAIWALLPNDGIALVATWFKNKVTQILLHMPYNRVIETEADDLGLVLAAKACFDVRESQVFWMNMAESKDGEVMEVEWLSTHPSSQNRAEHLSQRLPQALNLRKMCNCPPLPARDPVVEFLRSRKQTVLVGG